MHRRLIYEKILNETDNHKITVLIGPRQVGKTTLITELYKQLGGLFIDIDIYSQYEKVSTYANFINTLKLEGYKEDQRNPFYIYLDEFQRYPSLTNILKNIYDHHPNIKVFVTGSSSLAIKNEIQESLAGRKNLFYLYPLSFEEFLIFKDREDLIEKKLRLSDLDSNNLGQIVPDLFLYLSEFLVYGGYPEVSIAPEKDKKDVFESIFDLYIKKDLADYLKIEKIRNAKILIQQLSINNGSMANYSNYAQTAQIDTKTVINYIEILKETYLILDLKPYFTNKNKEISKAPKLYFIDNGVRNFFYNNFNAIELRNDAGMLFEGFCISEILKSGENPDYLKYYRSKNREEVDVILDRVSSLIPLELKYKNNIRKRDIQSLKTFMQRYQVERGYIVNLGEVGVIDNIYKKNPFNLSL